MPDFYYAEEPVHATFQSNGGELHLKNYNFSLFVPPLAVPADQEVNLKVGICCYGPFSISERYMLASDFVVIVADMEFSKSVKIVMGHCLCLPEYMKSSEVIILRADHFKVTKDGLYTFDCLTNPEISSERAELSFETEDFCILCAVLEECRRDRSPSSSSTSSLSNLIRQAHIDDDNPSSTPSSFDEETSVLGNLELETCPQRNPLRASSESSETGHDTTGGSFDEKSQTSPQKLPYNLRQRRSDGPAITSPMKKSLLKKAAMKRSRESNTSGSIEKKHCGIEYAALLFQLEKKVTDPQCEYKFAVFISTNCGGANKVGFYFCYHFH